MQNFFFFFRAHVISARAFQWVFTCKNRRRYSRERALARLIQDCNLAILHGLDKLWPTAGDNWSGTYVFCMFAKLRQLCFLNLFQRYCKPPWSRSLQNISCKINHTSPFSLNPSIWFGFLRSILRIVYQCKLFQCKIRKKEQRTRNYGDRNYEIW